MVGGFIDDEELCAVSVIRLYDSVQELVGPFVILSGHPKQTKVHEKFAAIDWHLGSQFVTRLFSYVGLFFKVDMSKWMMLSIGGVPLTCFGTRSSWCSPRQPKWNAQTSSLTCRALVGGVYLGGGHEVEW